MGRLALLCLGVAAAAMIGAPTLAGAATPAPPRAELEQFACHRSSNSLNRWIEVTAVMRPVPGTERMEMKFELLRKPPQDRVWMEVSGHGLGTWVHPTHPSTLGSRPGDHWSVQKPVLNLSSPAVYKFRVTFQWLDSGGRSLQTVVRLSRLCRQP